MHISQETKINQNMLQDSSDSKSNADNLIWFKIAWTWTVNVFEFILNDSEASEISYGCCSLAILWYKISYDVRTYIPSLLPKYLIKLLHFVFITLTFWHLYKFFFASSGSAILVMGKL